MQRIRMLAVLGLLSWFSIPMMASGIADASVLPASLLNGNGRCNIPPCTCDDHLRLTCTCSKDTEELILTSEGEQGLNHHTSRILVNNCNSVVMANHSLGQMDHLKSVDLMNVANLTLVRHSFKLSPRATNVRLTLRNASLDILPSNVFHGDVEAIVLDNVRVGQLAAFAFANLVNTNSITLEDCQIEDVEAQALKKFDVRYLHIIGGSLGREVPSRAINDVEVHEKFMLDGVRIGTVRSSAFVVKSPKTVAILRCTIDNLESEAFDIGVRGTVLIKNNTFGSLGFGAFLSIRADAGARSAIPNALHSLIFKNNNLTSFEEGSLVFDRTSFRTELSNILVNQACDCDSLALWRSQILNYTNVHSRLIGSREAAVVSAAVAPHFPIESSVEEPESFLCHEEPGLTANFADYEARNCILAASLLILVAVTCALLALLIFAVCVAIYCCRRRRRDTKKRWISVPTSAPDVVSKTKNGVISREGGTTTAAAGPVDSRITMVVPDGRLYRETEFHVIVEKAEPLTTEL